MVVPKHSRMVRIKATASMTSVGGYQGQALASGDLLSPVADLPRIEGELKLPDRLIPQCPIHWDLLAMPGPYDEGYLLSEDVDMLYNMEYEVGADESWEHHETLLGVSLTDAIAKRRRVEEFPTHVDNWCRGRATFADTFPLRYSGLPPSVETGTWGSAIVHQIQEKGNQPLVSYRQGGDDSFLIDYDCGAFDLNYHCRAVALHQKLHEASRDITFTSGLYTGILYYDGFNIPRQNLLNNLLLLEADPGNLSTAKMPSRKFCLPLTFSSEKQASRQRYIETQRPCAWYLSDTMDLIAENNAFIQQQSETSSSMPASWWWQVLHRAAALLAYQPTPAHELSEDKPKSRLYA